MSCWLTARFCERLPNSQKMKEEKGSKVDVRNGTRVDGDGV